MTPARIRELVKLAAPALRRECWRPDLKGIALDDVVGYVHDGAEGLSAILFRRANAPELERHLLPRRRGLTPCVLRDASSTVCVNLRLVPTREGLS